MKNIDSIKRSKKRTNVGTLDSFSRFSPSDRCNGTRRVTNDKRARLDVKRKSSIRSNMGGSNGKCRRTASHSANSLSATRSNPSKRNLKQSPEMRPRRRASQTYFFKYQLARNPLKAEEEDFKLALLASLQQCQDQDIKQPGPVESDQATITTDSAETPEIAEGKPATPEDIIQQYRPETEDFLTFICFRSTVPSYQNAIKSDTRDSKSSESSRTIVDNDSEDSNHGRVRPGSTPDSHCFKSHEPTNVRQMSSRLTSGLTAASPSFTETNHHNQSSNCCRRPTRQSPRLANSIQKKISENENSNLITSISNTAYDLPINYEEDLERASIALQDMAHEINSSDGLNNIMCNHPNDDDNNNFAQNSPDCISKLSKTNRHLVKGLMTREFAGAFADEETIFESISNHKL